MEVIHAFCMAANFQVICGVVKIEKEMIFSLGKNKNMADVDFFFIFLVVVSCACAARELF